MTRALDFAAGRPWAITPDMLELILEIAARENPSVAELEARLGRKLEYTRTVAMHGPVAVVPVEGPIMRRATWFSEISGATSTDVLARDIMRAVEDPNVAAVVLEIDSPGGEATGIGELATLIRAATAVKPVVAYVEGLGASAAYHLAAACSEIVCDPQAMLGSIGIVASISTKKRPFEAQFVSSQSPNKRPDLETDAGRAEMQHLVDELAAVFISDVARYRGTTPERVASDFGRGGVLVGAKAVAAGMAERTGTLESVIAELARGELPTLLTGRGAGIPPAHQGSEVHHMAEETKPTFGDTVKALLGLSPKEKKQALAVLASEAGEEPAAAPQAGSPPHTQPSAREQELEQKLEAERAARVKAEAANRTRQARGFAASLVKSSHVTAAQGEKLVELHARLAEDDDTRPLETGTRVEAFEALVTATSRPHGFGREFVAPAGATVLEPNEGGDDPVAAAYAQGAAYAKQANTGAGKENRHG